MQISSPRSIAHSIRSTYRARTQHTRSAPAAPLLATTAAMHRFVQAGARTAMRQAYAPATLAARGISSSSASAAAAAAAPAAAAPAAASSSPSAAAPSSAASSAAKILKYDRSRSSSNTFVQYESELQTGHNKQKGSKTGKLKKPHANVAPLLTRIWGKNGRFQTLAPEDWANIVLNNRRRLLQMKEKEQFRAWMAFQKLKAARFAWLKEKGEEVSPEMRARIEHREKCIIDMTKEARKQLSEPVPKLPLPPAPQTPQAKAMSLRAQANPQTFLKLALPQAVWRVFTFRLTHYHSHILHRQMEKFRELAKRLGLSPSRPTYLPHRMKKFNIIRSPHVFKRSREQYETRLYSLKISISPSVDKFYAIQRLCELSFRLINGNVKMRVETPANQAIESVVFAPNPTKAFMGHTPLQKFSVLDSPGIENILYKFDQHQFPFLLDWEEEILDEKFRGIYPKGFDKDFPYELEGERQEVARMRAEEAAAKLGISGSDPQELARSVGGDDSGAEFASRSDEAIFDERGEFIDVGSMGLADTDFEADEVDEEAEQEAAAIAVDDDRDARKRMEDLYEESTEPLVRRKKRHE